MSMMVLIHWNPSEPNMFQSENIHVNEMFIRAVFSDINLTDFAQITLLRSTSYRE